MSVGSRRGSSMPRWLSRSSTRPRCSRGDLREHHRGHDVLDGAEAVEQVEVLEDHSDRSPAKQVALCSVEHMDRRAVDMDAAFCWIEEPTDQMEQRALAVPRLRGEQHLFTLVQLELRDIHHPGAVTRSATLRVAELPRGDLEGGRRSMARVIFVKRAGGQAAPEPGPSNASCSQGRSRSRGRRSGRAPGAGASRRGRGRTCTAAARRCRRSMNGARAAARELGDAVLDVVERHAEEVELALPGLPRYASRPSQFTAAPKRSSSSSQYLVRPPRCGSGACRASAGTHRSWRSRGAVWPRPPGEVASTRKVSVVGWRLQRVHGMRHTAMFTHSTSVWSKNINQNTQHCTILLLISFCW